LVVVVGEPIEWLTVLFVSSRKTHIISLFRHHNHQGLHGLDGLFLEWMVERISISCDIMFWLTKRDAIGAPPPKRLKSMMVVIDSETEDPNNDDNAKMERYGVVGEVTEV
jgi:hypothetical protein